MNKALIGEEVTLEAAPDGQLAALVVSAAGAFLEAATGAGEVDASFSDAVRSSLAGLGDAETVRARLVVVAEGIDVQLSTGGASEVITLSVRG